VTLRTRSEPYTLVTRSDRTMSPVMRMFMEQLVRLDDMPQPEIMRAEPVPA